MRQAIAVLAIFAAGMLAGQLAPVQAADGADGVVRELREIRGELASIRRALEKGARP